MSGAVFVMSLFAAIWCIVGVAFSVALAVLGWRRDAPVAHDEQRRRGRIVGIASAVEGLAILVAVNVLVNTGRRDLVAPAVAIIVGVHFLPLARWLPAPIYYLTAALLVGVGAAGASAGDVTARIVIVGVGAAAVLWASCG